MKKIIDFTDKNIRAKFIICIVSGFSGVALSYLVPAFNAYLIDNIITKNESRLIPLWIGTALLFSFLLHGYLFYFLKYIWQKYGIKLINEIRKKLTVKLLHMPPHAYQDYNGGFLFNLIMGDANITGEIALNYVASTILSCLRILVCLVILLFINIKLFLLCLTFFPLYILAMSLNKKKLQKISAQERVELDSFIFTTNKVIEGKKHINLAGQEKYFSRNFETKMNNWLQVKLKYTFWFNFTREIPQLITTIAPFSLLAFGAGLVINQEITLGMLLMFTQYVGMLFEPLTLLAQVIVEKKAATPVIGRVEDFYTRFPETLPEELFPVAPPSCLLEIKNYRILNKDTGLLFRIDELKLNSRGLYVLKGDNGTGKTTFFNLLTSLADPNQWHPGKGNSRFSIHADFRTRLSYLYQPGFIFEGTVLENITFGNANPGLLAEICGVLGIENLQKKISFNPLNLSLGEQQKIALARILFENREFLLLDEPLANLDYDTRERLKNHLTGLKLRKCILIITHNPRLEQIADEILEISNNRLNIVPDRKKIYVQAH